MKPLQVLNSFNEARIGFFNFYVVEEFAPKNDDQEFFGLVQIFSYRTWAFFSLNQINELKKDYKIKTTSTPQLITDCNISLHGLHYSLKKAKEEKYYFNLSLVYLFSENDVRNYSEGRDYAVKGKYSRIAFAKKNPLILLAMDDKQEIFYQKKSSFSFRNSEHFRQPLFNCIFTQKISKLTNSTDLTKSLTSSSITDNELKVIRKFIITNWIKSTKPDTQIDFFLLGMIQTLFKTFGGVVLTNLIQKDDIHKIIKNTHLQDLESSILSESKLYANFIDLLTFFKVRDQSWLIKMLLNWDLPTDKVSDFILYVQGLEKAEIQIQYPKYSSLRYLFNVVSKEYTKLTVKNFKLPNQAEENLTSKLPAKFKEYSLVQPKDYKTLIQWGAFLHNCAGNFEQQEYYLTTRTIGLFKGDTLEYLASVKEGALSQLKGFKNSAPSKEIYEDFLKLLIEEKVVYPSSKKEIGYRECCIQRNID